ncbi:MAG: glycosyltransferase family 2 protein [Bacteroidetes bacterium]|nr:MAG: glycosyltransferase family 2 protein [Bacteroidota bacterium]
MIKGKTVTVVLPAYNASRTLRDTVKEIPRELVDHIILSDDNSQDDTLKIAADLPIDHILRHEENRGYGFNQKACYRKALELGSDIIVMLHPDYQYTPALIPSMCYLIADQVYPVVLASRILGRGALKGGMPRYKYIANRILTLIQNILMQQKLSEYHTGYRAYARHVLESVDFMRNSNDFLFDNQILAQLLYQGCEVAEITCPTHYFEEASSINFPRSVTYGIGVILTSLHYRMAKWNIYKTRIFK